MRFILKSLGAIAAIIVLTFLGGYLAYRGTPPMPATAQDDTTLPAVEIGGVTLHAESFGREEAPVVIVLHGGPGADYRSQLPLADLADSYRVVFYDQRGAGLSERLAREALTLDSHIEELRTLRGMFSPDRPVTLIGHSWGGILAAAYMGRFPQQVSRAVLIEPGFLDQAGLEAWQTRAQVMIDDFSRSFAGLSTVAAAVFGSLHISGPDDAARDDFFMGQMVGGFANHPDNPYHCPNQRYDAPSWRLGSLSMTAVPEQTPPAQVDAIAGNAARFAGPVLFLTGACDNWLGTSLQRRHAGLFANAQIVEIAGAGHDVVHDQPKAALAAIRAFLAGG
ncbi:MAG: alpha/beta fold hydrolase [Brevirhabdus sp.]